MALMDGAVVELGTWTWGSPSLPVELPTQPSLPQIKRLQDTLADLPQIALEPEHMFAPGMYIRTLKIPADSVVVGKMHRHAHPVFLLKGECTILTDKGMERIRAPHQWVGHPGAKRPLYTHTDCEFVTVHLNADDTQDLEALEAEIIIPEAQISYEEVAALSDLTDEIQRVYA